MDTWIADTEPSERFPIYTRANADEVGPDPFTPLNWTLTWEQGMVPGTADAWIALGTFEPEEFLWTKPETYGSWGGYFYNQVSLGRVFGYRMPGATPDAIDISFFGQNPTVPPYVHDPRDDNEACSAKLGESFGAILGGAQEALSADYLARAAAVAGQPPGSRVDHRRRARRVRPHLCPLAAPGLGRLRPGRHRCHRRPADRPGDR